MLFFCFGSVVVVFVLLLFVLFWLVWFVFCFVLFVFVFCWVVGLCVVGVVLCGGGGGCVWLCLIHHQLPALGRTINCLSTSDSRSVVSICCLSVIVEPSGAPSIVCLLANHWDHWAHLYMPAGAPSIVSLQ